MNYSGFMIMKQIGEKAGTLGDEDSTKCSDWMIRSFFFGKSWGKLAVSSCI